MKFKSYKCVFIGNIKEIQILINEKSNWEILGFLKISRNIFQTKNEPRSQELSPATVDKIGTGRSQIGLWIVPVFFNANIDIEFSANLELNRSPIFNIMFDVEFWFQIFNVEVSKWGPKIYPP